MDKPGKRQLAAVMFADIKGYTALVAEEEQLATRYVSIFKSTLIEQTEKASGKVINFYGDGSLSIYDSAVNAVKCAIEMQKVFRIEHNIPVRIGIHLGDIVVTEDNAIGDGVNVAARIESIGMPGNILISAPVNKQIENQNLVKTKQMGDYNFKNVKLPLGVFAVDHPDIYLPNKKELVGPKGQAVKNNLLKYIGLGLPLLALLIFFIYSKGSLGTSKKDFKTEKIAVPTFKNFTGLKDLDYIGEMSAHWITKELMQTEDANVIDYYTDSEINQISQSKVGESDNIFAKQLGAINIVEGSFEKYNQDTFSFSAYIKNIDNGEVLHAFEPVLFSKENPRVGISDLTNRIKGYWDSKDELFFSIPNFEAYKLYLGARNNWLDDSDLAKNNLLQSIEEDSTFLDAYFLLLGNLYNHQEFDKVEKLISTLKKKTDPSNAKEQNILNAYDAILKGKNKMAYSFIKDDLATHERDFFTTTEFMVIATDMANNSESVIKIFESQNIEDLNLAQCFYCQERYYLAINAYIKLNQMDKAKALIAQLPLTMQSYKYYVVQIKYHVLNNDHDQVLKVIENMKTYSKGLDYKRGYYYAAREYYLNNDFDNAIKLSDKFLEQNKQNPFTAWAYFFKNDYKKSLDGFYKNYASNPNYKSASDLGVLAALNQDDELAKRQIRILDKMEHKFKFGEIPYYKARIVANLNNTKEALDLLEAAIDQGAPFYINNVFENDPTLKSLNKNERFQTLINPE